jgi:HlyD family secretion protein
VKRLARKLVMPLLGLAVLGLLVYAFLPAPLEVDMTRVTRGPLRVTVDEDGKTRIRDRYVVSAPLAGYMCRVKLRAGDEVAAGQTVLALIEPTAPSLLDDRARAEAEARVSAAESRLKQRRSELDQAESSLEMAASRLLRLDEILRARPQGVSRDEHSEAVYKEQAARSGLQAAKQAVQVATHELAEARAALLRTRPRSPGEPDPGAFEVRSPISGKVLKVHQESAAVVTPGHKILEVGDPRDLEVEVDLLSPDAVRVAPGNRVLFEHWGGEAPLNGRVRRIEPAGFTKISALGVEEQRVWVLIDFTDPEEKWRRLGDAYRVETRVVIWERESVLKVPAGAVFPRGDGWAVYAVEDGRAVLRPVQVGRSNGLETQILGGLAEGDEVVLHAGDRVKDGTAVVPR